MNKLKVLAYVLVAFLLLKGGMIFIAKDLSDQGDEIEQQYIALKDKMDYLSTFEDSLIHNVSFRTKVLGQSFSRTEFDSVILKNREDTMQMKFELEEFKNNQSQTSQDFKVYQVIDSLLNLIIAMSGELLLLDKIQRALND